MSSLCSVWVCMGIFSLFGDKKLTPEWSYTPQGIIWRLQVSDSGSIIGECRDQEKKSTTFFCLDEEGGGVQWENLKVGDEWWVGLETVYRGVLFLHGFTQPDMPEHKGIVAVDIKSGVILWKNDDLTFWFAYGESVFGYKPMFEKRIGYSLDLRAGNIVKEYGDGFDELYSLRQVALNETAEPSMLFPEIYDESIADPQVVRFVKQETKNERIAGNIEHVRVRDLLLLNYHVTDRSSTIQEPMLNNRLEVVNVEKGIVLFSDYLSRGGKSPVPDSFFVKGDFLYFVKNQNMLMAVRLWRS